MKQILKIIASFYIPLNISFQFKIKFQGFHECVILC